MIKDLKCYRNAYFEFEKVPKLVLKIWCQEIIRSDLPETSIKYFHLCSPGKKENHPVINT